MPVLDIPHRVVKFATALPTFPARAAVHAQLAPKELFGDESLSGRLVVNAGGQQVQLRADMWHGGILRDGGGRLPNAHVSAMFFNLALRVEGSIAIVEGELDSEGSLRRCIEMVATELPALLSNALHAPVLVADVFGTVGERSFEVEVRGEFQNVMYSAGSSTMATSIEEEMVRISKVPAEGAARLFAAYRYVNHARWLAYRGAHPAQFAGEQLLNLNKAVEVLLPHGGSIEKLRTSLRSLGVREEVVELIAALAYVRNQVDVGHAAVEVLDVKEHCNLHTFVLYAMEIVGWLVGHVSQLAGEGRLKLSPLAANAKKPRDETLSRVGELLGKVNPVRPETFLRK